MKQTSNFKNTLWKRLAFLLMSCQTWHYGRTEVVLNLKRQSQVTPNPSHLTAIVMRQSLFASQVSLYFSWKMIMKFCDSCYICKILNYLLVPMSKYWWFIFMIIFCHLYFWSIHWQKTCHNSRTKFKFAMKFRRETSLVKRAVVT